ncbi:GntR family transcriptional regulator [Burkholderia multivorans]|uniref:GntR family transcriptional regulator n=1 Tax=Burkholderia multivorans TaxID=87883 RepID=UPI000CFE3CF0|nr:GntR family transcriptional regulator [Burkholderia multivorans]MBU9295797.1 GntR family transcriptional regulator [Burkholderia multivorans]MBU9302064.1 GntR family transcriptional regulator [Burkholderia multivorans]MBU9404939.1 GntR family transcriptional regulator [Burkholderia multivorans]MBU9499977.1 GntR family transcriptional regulator [Burkholderia multivorans]MBU9505264.1 GntR family transcriptional regulator [Burkholderia multivorans]
MNTILPDYPRADPLPDDAAGATVPTDDDALEPHARTLSEHAYHQLRQHIVEGHYPPGAKLRVEHLKNVYGVGAGTLREALTRLVSDALVVAEGQRGFRVTPMSVADLQAITRLRIHIEVDALRESVRSGDAAWEQRVRQSFEMLSAWEQPVSIEHRTAWEACNRRFHEALISAAATPWTYLILRMLSQQSERYRRVCIGLGDSKRDVHAEHTCLFEAAMRRADARAALALEDHIGATLAVVRNAPPGTLPF